MKNKNMLKTARIFAVLCAVSFLWTSVACKEEKDNALKDIEDYPAVETDEDLNEVKEEEETDKKNTGTETKNDDETGIIMRDYPDVTFTSNTDLEFDKDVVMANITKLLDEEGYLDTQFLAYSEQFPDFTEEGRERYYLNSYNDEDGVNKNYIAVVIDEYPDSESALQDYPGSFGAIYQMDEDEVEDGLTFACKIGEDNNGGFGYQVITIKGNYIFKMSVFLYKSPSFHEDEDPSEVDIDYYTFKTILDENNIAYSILEEEKYGYK